MIVGIVYCAVIEACQEIFDLRRAQEWTAALTTGASRSRTWCRTAASACVYRAELMQLHGAWPDADAEARGRMRATRRAAPEPAVGEALYQQAELHRLRGEFAEAEEAYRQASRLGRRPQPGLALLRLAQGRPMPRPRRSAARSTRPRDRCARSPAARPRTSRSCWPRATSAAARPRPTSWPRSPASVGAPLLRAMAARADGAVLLAEGDAPGRAGRAAPGLGALARAGRAVRGGARRGC